MRFVTVTLSPMFERTLVTDYLAVGYQNKTVRPERLDPSGPGMDIARALHRLGCETQAVALLGYDLSGRAYHALVGQEGFGFTGIFLEGPMPSRTSILDTKNGQETVITSNGFQIDEADLQRLADSLEAMVTSHDVVVFAGPLPAGAPEDAYARLIEVVHAAGAGAVLHAGGPALSPALAAQPELVALSQLECEVLFNVPIRVQEDLLMAARSLREQGAGRVLLEMKQRARALLVTEDGHWLVDLPADAAGTTSGVWEALLAGFLAGRCRQVPLEESLVMAAAAAAYVADEAGLEFASPQDVREYRPQVQVREMESA